MGFEKMDITEAKYKIVLCLSCPARVEEGSIIFVKDERGIRRVQVAEARSE